MAAAPKKISSQDREETKPFKAKESLKQANECFITKIQKDKIEFRAELQCLRLPHCHFMCSTLEITPQHIGFLQLRFSPCPFRVTLYCRRKRVNQKTNPLWDKEKGGEKKHSPLQRQNVTTDVTVLSLVKLTPASHF